MLESWVPKPSDPEGGSPALTPAQPFVEVKELKEVQKQAEQAIQRVEKKNTRAKFEQFGERYFNDPVAFARDCIRWPRDQQPTPYQEDIWQRIVDKRRVAVVGPRGLGKSCCCSILVLWFGLTREAVKADWKCPITSGDGKQLFRYFWPEVKKWERRLNWDVIGRKAFDAHKELLMTALQLDFGQAFLCSPVEPGRIEGAHADELLFCFDESKLIVPAIWNSAEGAFSGAGPDTGINAYSLAISTPGGPNGFFYDIHAKKPGMEYWDTLHVRMEEAVAAGRMSPQWIEEKRRQWGETSSIFKQHCLGEFAADDEDSVIPLEWVRRVMEWEDDPIPSSMSV